MDTEQPPVNQMSDEDLAREHVELAGGIAKDHRPGETVLPVSLETLDRFRAVRHEERQRREKGRREDPD
jgi:hypothetical protein